MATTISETEPQNRKPAAPKPARAKRPRAAKPANGSAKPAAKTQRRRVSRTGGLTSNPFAIGAAAAAVGVVAALAANLGRKAVVQAPSALAGDWFEALKAEHKATFAIFDRIQATRDNQRLARVRLLSQLKHALAKHAMEEENVVYPALRDVGDRDDADRLNHDHGYVKQYLYDLEIMAKDDPAWLPKVADFRRDLEKHVHYEEEEVFPLLQGQLSADEASHVTTALNKEGFKAA